jgi:hypothetical protein
VILEYVSIRKALRAVSRMHASQSSSRSLAEVALATPRMQAVQGSWKGRQGKGPGIRLLCFSSFQK